MAWIDDRIWCHPKLADLSDHAFAIYVKAIAYSSGMSCRGYLTAGQQKVVGATPRGRKELVAAGLWDTTDAAKTVYIHDWEEHNSKRDDRRESDRERKKRERETDPDGWITRSGKWQQTRKAVLERDRGICVDCGQVTDSWHADHVPDRATLRERGDDPFSSDFIQTRCHRCHSRRHSLERAARRKATDSGTDTHGQNNGQKLRTDERTESGQTSGPARVDGSEGSEGSDGTTKPSFLPAVAKDPAPEEKAGRRNLLDADKVNPFAEIPKAPF